MLMARRFISSGNGQLEVVRSQASFDVRDRDLPMERGDRRPERARRVALDDDGTRLVLVQQLADATDRAAQDVVERLTRAHQLEVLIEADPEDGQHLIDQLHVLAGPDDGAWQPERAEAPDQRRELDGLGTGAEEHGDRAGEPTSRQVCGSPVSVVVDSPQPRAGTLRP